MHKERQGGRVVSVTTQVVFGRAEELLAHLVSLGMRQINTSFVEPLRVNLTLRHLVSRLKRRGLNFSKKREYLVWHLQLAIGYYHWVCPHRGLRLHLAEPVPTRGTPKKWEQRAPAMAAGLTDHIWALEELRSACSMSHPGRRKTRHGQSGATVFRPVAVFALQKQALQGPLNTL